MHNYICYSEDQHNYSYNNNSELFLPVIKDTTLPTLAQFQQIMNNYLNNLSPKKRDKALIDQERYHLIQEVLKNPRNTMISTAQFRFWVKKMFRLEYGDFVYHDGKPVAIKEKIYDFLVHAHKQVLHGGRDKTSAMVRKHHSYIPKELVAKFVRSCPTCQAKRNACNYNSNSNSRSSSPKQESYEIKLTPSFMYSTPSLHSESDITPPSTSSGVSRRRLFLNNEQQPELLMTTHRQPFHVYEYSFEPYFRDNASENYYINGDMAVSFGESSST